MTASWMSGTGTGPARRVHRSPGSPASSPATPPCPRSSGTTPSSTEASKRPSRPQTWRSTPAPSRNVADHIRDQQYRVLFPLMANVAMWHPYVEGFNGEWYSGVCNTGYVYAHVWLDPDQKKPRWATSKRLQEIRARKRLTLKSRHRRVGRLRLSDPLHSVPLTPIPICATTS